MESKINGTNELNYKTNRITDVKNNLMLTRGKRGGINWEIETENYTLLYIK